MNLTDLEKVTELEAQLRRARQVLHAFERHPHDTVPAQAIAGTGVNSLDFTHGAKVQLPDVPKAHAVSAARREVSKIVAQLQQLGVTVEEG